MNKSKQKIFLSLVAVILIAGGIFFLSVRRSGTTKRVEPSVAATIFPIYDIAKNITGDAVEITLILPAGADAHSFEPAPSLLTELSKAEAVYTVGYHLDEWIEVLADSVGTKIVLVDENIKLRTAHEHEHEEEEEEEEETGEHEHGPIDPHYWLSVSNAKIIAETIAADLAARFPKQTQTFSDNLETYQQKLDALDLEIRATLKDIPNKNIVTFHDAWYYFAKEYGLTVAGTFEPTAGREPTLQHLTELVSKINKASVKTIYYEPQMSVSGYETFANDYDIDLKILDDIGGIAPYDSYLNLMKTNAITLQNNQ